MKTIFASLTAAWLSLGLVNQSLANAKYCDAAMPDGVQLETKNERLVSISRVPVKFNDSAGRRKARVIAQERAKGDIVRFFEQNQTTIRKVTTEDGDFETVSQLTDETGRSTRKEYTREQSDVLVEMETSIASGNLSGIRQVEELFDANLEEVCVAMGFSSKSGQGAKDAQQWMRGDKANELPPNADAKGDSQESGSYSRSIEDNW